MCRLERELARAQGDLAATRDLVDQVTGSRSWRYTAHLRNAVRTARERLHR
jgi:hypothetical protein